MDVLNPEQRRRCMSSIKGSEYQARGREALFSLGFRYRLHDKRLPGTPDLFFPRYRAVVFIHGRFWHGHSCKLFVVPATNTAFWVQKIGGNRARDEREVAALRAGL